MAKEISLNFAQRFGLVNMLTQASGQLGKMAHLQSIFGYVRFTDEDLSAIKITQVGNGMEIYTPPNPDWGGVQFVIEEGQANTLKQEFDSFAGFRVQDIAWVDAIKAQLNAPSVTLQMRKKR